MMSTLSIYKFCVALIAASLAIAVGAAAAQPAGSRQTREFLQSTASLDQYEVLSAETALAQSTNSQVRSFAARMLDEHQQFTKAVVDAAAKSGLAAPEMAMSADQAQMLAALQGVKGKDFDAAYFNQQVLVHRSELVVDEIYTKTGDDPNLLLFVKSLASLRSSDANLAHQAFDTLGDH